MRFHYKDTALGVDGIFFVSWMFLSSHQNHVLHAFLVEDWLFLCDHFKMKMVSITN